MHVRSSIEPFTEHGPDGAVHTAVEKTSARTVLVVEDDDAVSALLIDLLQERGYHAVPAFNGKTALSLARRLKPHLITLDLALPHLDGQAVLERLKADPGTRDIPVVVISALDEMDSVIRCIKLGAADYLPKPFNAALLHARISASLAAKRLRDLELEYLEQVAQATAAAVAVESDSFVPGSLDGVAAREDALGHLARVFQRMAREVRTREELLQRQVRELRIEIDQARQAERVAEVTETDYFQRLRSQADELRRLMNGG